MDEQEFRIFQSKCDFRVTDFSIPGKLFWVCINEQICQYNNCPFVKFSLRQANSEDCSRQCDCCERTLYPSYHCRICDNDQ
jgi:hypothetical protein